jgi:DNA invertase Pin-like site-specific DNA recombinase
MSGTANEKEKLKKRGRVKHATMEGITVTKERSQPNFFEDDTEMNVGIYARVSTNSSQQTLSYEMQQKYYSEMVARRPNWTLLKIYHDEGKTGTSTRHRDGFNSMIKDCKEGKLDLIIVKSVSRFSRNIVDAIVHVRELAAQKPAVGVYFENEGIYTLNPKDEMRLSFIATMAQEESRAKSVAMESSIVMRFSHGMFLTPPLLGYDNDEDGKLVINEDEATTVRLIFFMYLTGYNTREIAEKLTELGRTTKNGNTQWSAGSVYGQLINERHCGAVIGRKTWTPNFLDHLVKKNRTYKNGITDKKQYTKLNHHEAIISHDDFVATQKMIANVIVALTS